MSTESVDELLGLLDLAHAAVRWADQCHEGIRGSAGGKHYFSRRDAYYEARLTYFAPRRPLTVDDTCPTTYLTAAEAQPWNHRIPWNCPTFWDGCNCDGGPYYSLAETESSP